MNKQTGRILFAAGMITAALASGAIAQQDEKLGKVSFPTSAIPMCRPSSTAASQCCIPTGS